MTCGRRRAATLQTCTATSTNWPQRSSTDDDRSPLWRCRLSAGRGCRPNRLHRSLPGRCRSLNMKPHAPGNMRKSTMPTSPFKSQSAFRDTVPIDSARNQNRSARLHHLRQSRQDGRGSVPMRRAVRAGRGGGCGGLGVSTVIRPPRPSSRSALRRVWRDQCRVDPPA